MALAACQARFLYICGVLNRCSLNVKIFLLCVAVAAEEVVVVLPLVGDEWVPSEGDFEEGDTQAGERHTMVVVAGVSMCHVVVPCQLEVEGIVGEVEGECPLILIHTIRHSDAYTILIHWISRYFYLREISPLLTQFG